MFIVVAFHTTAEAGPPPRASWDRRAASKHCRWGNEKWGRGALFPIGGHSAHETAESFSLTAGAGGWGCPCVRARTRVFVCTQERKKQKMQIGTKKKRDDNVYTEPRMSKMRLKK